MIAFDRVKQRLEIVSIVFTEEAGGSHDRLRELYDQAVARTKEVEDKIFERDRYPQLRNRSTRTSKTFRCSQTFPAELLKKVCDR